MNRTLKLAIMLITLAVICFAFVKPVMADYKSEMSSLIGAQENSWSDTTGTSTKVENITGTIISVVRIAGVAIAVVMLLTLAMKYMSAAPGEKADIKKSAIVYVVGAVVLFAVVGILGIIEKFSGAIK